MYVKCEVLVIYSVSIMTFNFCMLPETQILKFGKSSELFTRAISNTYKFIHIIPAFKSLH